MFDGSSMAGKRFRAARSLSTDEPARPTGEPTRLLYGYLKPKNTLRAAQSPGAPPLRIGTPTRWMFDGSSTAGKRFRAARSLSTDEPEIHIESSTRILQPQPLYILDSRQDDITAAADHAGQRVDDRVQERFHFLAGRGDGVDVQLIPAGHAVNLRDGIVPV